jgi:hypothetical protein
MRYTESVFGCIGEVRKLIAYVCQPEIGNPPWIHEDDKQVYEQLDEKWLSN